MRYVDVTSKARLAAKKEAIFGGQYLVDISVRRPNINQILTLQQEGKYRLIVLTGTIGTICEHRVNHGVKRLWPLPWPVAR